MCFPKVTATTKFASFLIPDPNNKTQCIDMNEDQKKQYCQDFKLDDSPETNFIYRNGKCMKIFTEEECKNDKSPPNYENNQFYSRIFYKKPDESKDNTACRKLTKEEEKVICEKPDNNSLWLGNKCIKKLSKPTVVVHEQGVGDCRFLITFEEKVKFTDYNIHFNVTKNNSDYQLEWNKRSISLGDINEDKLYFVLNELVHNTEYKIKIKLQNNTYVDFQSPESDELVFKTICDNSL